MSCFAAVTLGCPVVPSRNWSGPWVIGRCRIGQWNMIGDGTNALWNFHLGPMALAGFNPCESGARVIPVFS